MHDHGGEREHGIAVPARLEIHSQDLGITQRPGEDSRHTQRLEDSQARRRGDVDQSMNLRVDAHVGRESARKIASLCHQSALQAGLRGAIQYYPDGLRSVNPEAGRKPDWLRSTVSDYDSILASLHHERIDTTAVTLSDRKLLALANLAVCLAPDVREYKITRASIYVHLQDYSRSLSEFEALLKDPMLGSLRSRVLANCSAVYERFGDKAAALRYAKAAVEQPVVSRLAALNYSSLLTGKHLQPTQL